MADGMEIRISYGKRDACDSIAFNVDDAEPCDDIGLMLAGALGYCTQEPIFVLAHALDFAGRPRDSEEHPAIASLLDAAAAFCDSYRKTMNAYKVDAFNES